VEVEVVWGGAGPPAGWGPGEAAALAADVEKDLGRAAPLACARAGLPPPPAGGFRELAVVLCGDGYIRELNKEWRGKDAPTDVLSFPQGAPLPGCPVQPLGDLVVSVETAARQAGLAPGPPRGPDAMAVLRAELRLLATHGVCHLLGHDHEGALAEAGRMAVEEDALLEALGWAGEGMVSKAGLRAEAEGGGEEPAEEQGGPAVKLLALDLDGTLLDSDCRVPGAAAEAVRAAQAAGTEVVVATGKARSGAFTALRAVGLSPSGGGDGPSQPPSGYLAAPELPGVFLQGLETYGRGGRLLQRHYLPPEVVLQAFAHVEGSPTGLCAFGGDAAGTLAMTPEVLELHERYHEPKADVFASAEELLSTVPPSKLVFLAPPAVITGQLRPYWEAQVAAHPDWGVRVLQVEAMMLELVPEGVSKETGLRLLMEERGLAPGDVVAVGDGNNDVEMLRLVGAGVAVGNASEAALAAADHVVASSDEGGVAEAIRRFVL